MSFTWETAEYPCLGEHVRNKHQIVCFSSYGVGHNIKDAKDCSNSWHMMEQFKPYTPPKPKKKLWYWEILHQSGDWFMCEWRMTENDVAKKFIGHKIVKLEALGFIEED